MFRVRCQSCSIRFASFGSVCWSCKSKVPLLFFKAVLVIWPISAQIFKAKTALQESWRWGLLPAEYLSESVLPESLSTLSMLHTASVAGSHQLAGSKTGPKQYWEPEKVWSKKGEAVVRCRWPPLLIWQPSPLEMKSLYMLIEQGMVELVCSYLCYTNEGGRNLFWENIAKQSWPKASKLPTTWHYQDVESEILSRDGATRVFIQV